jgi:hypothetical protein
MKKQKVKFIPKDKDSFAAVEYPKPSKQYIAQWFKDMPMSLSDLDNNKMESTAKKCMPFMDSLTSGYTQELLCDVEIKNHGIDPDTGNDILSYNFAGSFKPLSTRVEDTRSRNVFPNFDGYYNTEFHWISHWEPQTPPGYSTLYYHPANRFDLPFTTCSAIIDTDKWSLTGPVPFLIKKGFEGIIPAGTPIYQMIFIKREDWLSEKSNYNQEYDKQKMQSIKRFFRDGYKRVYWSRKNYN